jgi:hypothetical protein
MNTGVIGGIGAKFTFNFLFLMARIKARGKTISAAKRLFLCFRKKSEKKSKGCLGDDDNHIDGD